MVLVVNGEKIEDERIRREVERLRPEYERVFANLEPQAREKQLLEWSRENVIEQVLISQEARSRNYPIPEEQIERVLSEIRRRQETGGLSVESGEKLGEQVAKQIMVEKLIEEITEGVCEPTEEQVYKYYCEHQDRFTTSEQIRVSHIVKHVSADAEAVMKEVEAELQKGLSFESLVDKYSDCPDNNGDLGYIIRGQMVEEFDDVVFNLGVGEISGVFQTRFGFHIAKVYDRQQSFIQEFKSAKPEIRKVLRQQKEVGAVEEFVDHLKAKAEIEEL